MNDEIRRIGKIVADVDDNIIGMNKNFTILMESVVDINKKMIMTKNEKRECNCNNSQNVLDAISRLENVENIMQKMNCSIDKINLRLENVEKSIQKIQFSTKNMDNHIDFVENVYTVVKKPFVSLLGFYYNKNKDIKNELENLKVKRIVLDSDSYDMIDDTE